MEAIPHRAVFSCARQAREHRARRIDRQKDWLRTPRNSAAAILAASALAACFSAPPEGRAAPQIRSGLPRSTSNLVGSISPARSIATSEPPRRK